MSDLKPCPLCEKPGEKEEGTRWVCCSDETCDMWGRWSVKTWNYFPRRADTRSASDGVRPEVWAMALMMEAQLKRNDHRGGWKDMRPGELHERIHFNQLDLAAHRVATDKKAYGRTCADIANFAMMLADNAQALALLPSNPATTKQGGGV